MTPQKRISAGTLTFFILSAKDFIASKSCKILVLNSGIGSPKDVILEKRCEIVENRFEIVQNRFKIVENRFDQGGPGLEFGAQS